MNQTDLYPELLKPYDPRHTPLPPPAVDICAGPVHTICINAEWWSHVSGMIARLTDRDAWAGTDTEISDAIESITKILNVGRPTMGCGCGDSGLPSRFTEDGTYQVSYDGGVTWVDAPEYDPRNNVVLLPPPTVGTGEDGKCKAANSGVAMFKKQQADNASLIEAGASITEFNSEIVAFIIAAGLATGVGGIVGAIIVVIGAIAALLVSVGSSAFNAAFDDAVWDRLLCSLYCNMGDDLAFTEAQYQAVKAKALEEPNIITRTWLDKYIWALGAKGLTNLVRMGALGTMSCESCDCNPPSDVWFARANNTSYPLYPDEDGFYTAETGSETAYPGIWYGTVWFREPPATNESPYANCWRLTEVTFPGGVTAPGQGVINCTNGEYEPFPPTSFCYAAIQYATNAPWSIKFKVVNPCP